MQERAQRIGNAVFLSYGFQSVSIGVTVKVAISAVGTHERALRVQRHFRKASVQHGVIEVDAKLFTEITDGLHRSVFVLADEHHRVAGGFLVRADGHERFLVGGDSVGLFLAGVLFGGDVAEHSFDFAFHFRHVDITYHNHRL